MEEDRFTEILKQMSELHDRKNADYGNAWHEEFQEFGPVCGVLRLYEKTKRLKSLYQNGRAQVYDESFEDTLIDIANYAVMTLAELREYEQQRNQTEAF